MSSFSYTGCMPEGVVGLIEVSAPCTCSRRMPDLRTVTREVSAWQKRRNAYRATIEWNFTRQDADRKLRRHYVS